MRANSYGWTDVPQDQALDLAREAADKALKLSPDNYNAHYTRAYVHLIAGEQEQAIARFRKAIELNPSAANVMAALPPMASAIIRALAPMFISSRGETVGGQLAEGLQRSLGLPVIRA